MSKSTKKTLQQNHPIPQGEEGIALLLSLLMGLVILGGVSGLLLKQLGARKDTAGESYQQMAETAAANGFNRILSALNDGTPGEYLGYLYRVNSSNSNGSNWQDIPQLEEPCSAKNNNVPAWLLSQNNLQSSNESLREEELGDLKSSFKLRKYVGPVPGKSSAQFEVEGFVTKEGSENSYEARSLLIRSLYINSKVATSDDWAVLAARHFRLGEAKVDGEGKILWLMSTIGNFTDSDSCNASNLLGALGASNRRETDLAKRIWPVINISDNQWDIPTNDRFERDGTYDKVSRNNNKHRIWSFDDSPIYIDGKDIGRRGLVCGNRFSIVCARPSSTNPTDDSFSVPVDDGQIKVEADSDYACVTDIRFTSGKYNTDFYPGEIYPNTEICNEYNVFSMRNAEIPKKQEITIKSSDLCDTTSNEDVCHVFVEHINLSTTRVFIQNDDRPVVIHMELPATGGIRRSDLTNTYRYSFKEGSKFCGADSDLRTSCNNKAEAFIIASAKGNVGATCNDQPDNSTLVFGGNTLPAAWINLPKGRVELNSDTTLNGVIWSNSICTGQAGGPSHNLTLITNQINGDSVVEAAEAFWGWDVQKRYGRTVVRGVRGTGFDTFTRF